MIAIITVYLRVSMKVKVLITHSYLTLCSPVDYSSPGSSVHGILQARILEWVPIPFSSESSQPRDRTRVSCVAWGFSQDLWSQTWVCIQASSFTSYLGKLYNLSDFQVFSVEIVTDLAYRTVLWIKKYHKPN